jgi:translation initiation factor eIF-2B subunit epsilon
MGKSSSSSTGGGTDPSDNKHDQKLQAVLLADTFSNSFHPITLEDFNRSLPGIAALQSNDDDNNNSTVGNSNKGGERPLALCPLNNVPLLHHTVDFLQSAGVEELFLLCSSGADALGQYLTSHHKRHHHHSPQQQQQQESTNKIAWSSKLTIHLLRFTDCTNTGDALRELDRRNVIKSDPFILMQGDVVTNVDLRDVMDQHATRKKRDNSAIMTVLLQEVGGWGADDDDDIDDDDEEENDNITYSDNPNAAPDDHRHHHRAKNTNNKTMMQSNNHFLPQLRSSTDDLLLAIDTTHSNRILLWDSHPHNSTISIPTSFFAENSSHITVTRNYLDVGIDICSPDVLARFSDEFDYRELRSQFVANCVAEEEVGLQSRIFGYMLKRGEYAGRMGDMRRYHRVSMDLLRRWGYPLVPDNYNHSCSGGSYHEASYVCERHLVYRDVSAGDGRGGKRSHVGRSTQLLGPLLLGPNNSIGEYCHLQRSVLGPNCTLMDDCHVIDSHLWGDVLVETGAKLNCVIVCEGAIIRSGAIIDRGCVIGRGCIIGVGVHLKEFTRITLAADEVEDDDEYSGFDDTSSSGSSSKCSSSSGTDDEESSADECENAKVQGSNIPEATQKVENHAVVTNHEVVGKDGLGRVWVPSPSDDYDSDDDEDEAQASAIELMKSESIGYDMTLMYKKWKKLQMEDEDDGFSLECMGSDDEDDDMDMDDHWADDTNVIDNNNAGANALSHLDEDGMQITGRQKGVDVVQELRDICLEHETSSPVENLRIELNSFKFSQNATYSDCCKGAMMAVMDKVLEEYPESNPSPGKLVASLKKTLEYWQQLFHSICMGSEEEKAIIHALETMALGSGKAAEVLGKEPAFRFVLQTLHDQEIVNEVAIFEWAGERKEEGREFSNPRSALFWQKPTQDFLEWLEASSDEDSSDGSDDEGSD